MLKVKISRCFKDIPTIQQRQAIAASLQHDGPGHRGAGYIGSHMVHAFVDAGERVVAPMSMARTGRSFAARKSG